MDERFADWYRLVSITPTPELLRARWEVIESEATSADSSDVLELLALYFDRKVRSEFQNKLVKAFQEGDPTFKTSGNDAEIHVLSAALLSTILTRGSAKTANTAAFGLLAGDYQGISPQVPIADPKADAFRWRIEKAVKNRPDGLNGIGKPQNTLEATIQPIRAAIASGNLAALQVPLEEILGRTITDTRTLQLEYLRQNEEVNVLWWVFGGVSAGLNRHFADLEWPIAAPLAGKELADLVTLPGPVSAEPILSRILNRPGQETEISLFEAVNSLDNDWKLVAVSGKKSELANPVCPFHLGLQKSLETDSPIDWASSVDKVIPGIVKRPLKSTRLALQVFWERMLLIACN